jgi:hypothetical protein
MKTGLLAFLWLALAVLRPFWLQTGSISIASPRTGEVLQGTVTIQGTLAAPGFRSLELSFAYAGAPGDTWFPIGEIDQPVVSGALMTWDTTTLTDGDYDLRAVAHLADGSSPTIRVNRLRVRNYTPIEKAAAQTSPIATAVPPTDVDLIPTLAPLAVNPASVSWAELEDSLKIGALTAAGVFVLLGLYRLIRGRR